LVSANILPKECCKLDRRSGDFIWGVGVAGPLVARKRQLERERLKEGLRVWLDRKAREIRARKKEGVGVGVLVWRFSKKLKMSNTMAETGAGAGGNERPRDDRVRGLRRFWEGLGRSE